MEFLIIPVVFGFAAASVARGKNRNPYLWFALGLVTGPFALVALVVMKAGPGEDQGYE
ncbi:hypothetical protein [Desulfuromonas sp. DDH964]|uniref:hypothetical protein n=1 Tax=Desulfuromonas sp. DDH964 TaxID=1823759 RepID=UPI00078D1263|nr:hypothetical protein [Desulfuromonas sp. DDH964]AMV71560.1 hypothetical protein DBW_1186 [Desulfuromonas sp. DDH964]